jgi:hypothetical protein
VHFVEALTGELVDGGGDGEAVVAHERRLEDRVLREEGVLVGAELRTDVVDVGDELAAHLGDEGQETVTVEVDPDQRAGDAALVARERSHVGRTECVDGGFLSGNAVRDCLKLGELILADDAANIRAGERVVDFALVEIGTYAILFLTTEIYLSY